MSRRRLPIAAARAALNIARMNGGGHLPQLMQSASDDASKLKGSYMRNVDKNEREIA